MKKGITTGLIALLATTSVTPVAFADGNESAVEEEQQVDDSVNDDTEKTGEESVELIDTLTLDAAIEQALTGKSSLMLLQYQLDRLKSQLAATEDDHRESENDLDDLEDQMEDLKELQNTTDKRTFQQRLQIQNAIEDLEDGIEQLEESLKQLNSNKINLEYSQKEARESIKAQTTNTFMQLVMTKDQLQYSKDSLENQRQQVKNTKRRYDIGLVSRNEFHTAQRELTRIQSQIDQSESKLKNDMTEFALDLGVTYHEDLKLQAPKIESIELMEQEKTTEELIENSYSMKNAKEELALAEYNRDQKYEDAEENGNDIDSHDLEQADLTVKEKEENITQLKVDLEKAINDLFTQVDNQYQAVFDARYELDYAQADDQNLQRRLDVGLVSKAEYELSQNQLQKAQLDHKTAKQNYFILTKQVELLRAGVIQTTNGM